jgi:membrane-associated phospholipid phosphatase
MNKSNFFYIGAFISACIFLVVHYLQGPIEAVLRTNGMHNPVLDYFFKYLTMIGEWLGILVCAVVILIKRKWKWFVPLATLNIVAGIISYLLKHHVFMNSFRPRKVLNNDSLIHFVEGVSVNTDFSYPSGHTLTIMAVSCFMAMVLRHHLGAQIAVLVFCLLAAISRVYLFQHFYIDIASSIFIGISVNGLLLYFFRSYFVDNHQT